MTSLETEPRPVALAKGQRRQLIWITLGAIAIYVTMRLLPTGTNLNHGDFQVKGGTSIQFCDAHNPQFIPVVAVKSPVTMTVSTDAAPQAGREVHAVLSLHTFSGKPIAPQDLLEVHTKLIHLMVIDPSLTDYEHVHPQPGKTPGDWTFTFTPRYSGTYRLFADFTPVATARGLYANADVEVAAGSGAAHAPDPATLPHPQLDRVVDYDGYRFLLRAAAHPIRVRQLVDLTFQVEAPHDARVPLQPIMGAFAHLVAFDSGRNGFAHLHPDQPDPLTPPDPIHPALKFKVTIPTAGTYVIWTQVNLGGHEVFVPYWFDVEG